MDSQSSENSGLSSSPAVSNQSPVSGLLSQNSQQVSGSQARNDQKEGITTSTPLPGLPVSPLQPTLQNSTTIDTSNSLQTPLPSLADDKDLIEKEWVDKAKQIVEQNREDPYEQSKELTIFKADYMKKRYNRTIKLSE